MTFRLIVTPMGEHQIRTAAAASTTDCTCDPAWADVARDLDCPEHGLAAFLLERLEADAQRGGDAA